MKKYASIFFIFVVVFILSGCGVGSGPYSSERQTASALKKYMKKECQCGEARYRYFNNGENTRVSGCERNGRNVEKVLNRYDETPNSYKTSRIVSLHSNLYGCWAMD